MWLTRMWPIAIGTALTIDGTVTSSADITLTSISALAISGTLTMTAGTLTLTRGNGGSALEEALDGVAGHGADAEPQSEPEPSVAHGDGIRPPAEM